MFSYRKVYKRSVTSVTHGQKRHSKALQFCITKRNLTNCEHGTYHYQACPFNTVVSMTSQI